MFLKVLKSEGITDLVQYACDPSNANNLMPDFFLDSTGPASIEVGDAGSKPAQSSAEPVGEVGKLFKAIESTLSPEVVSKTQAVFAFVVTGDEAGKWYVFLCNLGKF